MIHRTSVLDDCWPIGCTVGTSELFSLWSLDTRIILDTFEIRNYRYYGNRTGRSGKPERDKTFDVVYRSWRSLVGLYHLSHFVVYRCGRSVAIGRLGSRVALAKFHSPVLEQETNYRLNGKSSRRRAGSARGIYHFKRS